MNLFAAQEEAHRQAARPLAARMRPRTLDEFVGQSHLLGEGRLLRRMLDADRIGSVIFYGPPGTGKTSLAEIIARHTKRRFRRLNAAMAGVKDVRAVLDDARNHLDADGQQTICFIDEIHRFSRSQQDILLPDVEEGTISLIGATTASPFYSLVAPLISRSRLFEFRELTADDVRQLLHRALEDEERGLGRLKVEADRQALDLLVELSDGDARRALTALEIAALSAASSGGRVDTDAARAAVQQRVLRYDRAGDDHYDVASAFIKSIRGSDPDAALYWLARMLESGEDPRFVARRLVISASEDIGNADPQALLVATAAFQATETIGMPECRICLAQAVTYLACCPKSNACYTAVDAALNDVRNRSVLPVPVHLRNRPAGESGDTASPESGTAYRYPHDMPDGWCDQDYLGVDRIYYQPTDRGREAEFHRRLKDIRSMREQKRNDD